MLQGDCARTASIAGVHNENDEMVRAAIKAVEASGIRDYRAHALSRPPVSETLAMAEVYEIGAADRLLRRTSCIARSDAATICAPPIGGRASTPPSRPASTISCSTRRTTSARLGGKAKINPPIRPRREVEALWHHLAAGNVTVVSTDHVSWSEDRKSDPDMLKNASGVPGLEVLYALLLKGLTGAQSRR